MQGKPEFNFGGLILPRGSRKKELRMALSNLFINEREAMVCT